MLTWIISALKFFGSSLLDKIIKLGKDLYFEYVTKRRISKEAEKSQEEMERAKRDLSSKEDRIKATDEFLNKRGRP